jgi:hypothetical protein
VQHQARPDGKRQIGLLLEPPEEVPGLTAEDNASDTVVEQQVVREREERLVGPGNPRRLPFDQDVRA